MLAFWTLSDALGTCDGVLDALRDYMQVRTTGNMDRRWRRVVGRTLRPRHLSVALLVCCPHRPSCM